MNIFKELELIKAKYINRQINFDADDTTDTEEEEPVANTSYGNTRLPFGLCKRFGIDIGKNWTPSDAWDALAGRGIYHDDVIKQLSESGSTQGITPKDNESKAPEASKRKTDKELMKSLMEKSSWSKQDKEDFIDNMEDGIVYKDSHSYTRIGDKFYKKAPNGKWREIDRSNVMSGRSTSQGYFSYSYGYKIEEDGEADIPEDRDEYYDISANISTPHDADGTKEALKKMPDGSVLKGTIHYTSGATKDIYVYKVGGSYYYGDENGISPSGNSKKTISQIASVVRNSIRYSSIDVSKGENTDTILDEFNKKQAENKRIKKADAVESDSYLASHRSYGNTRISRDCGYNNVEYKVVKPLSKEMDSEQIIDYISGGDETKGSCVSAAMSYIGCKHGLDVRDFRGNKSQNIFSMIDSRGFFYDIGVPYESATGSHAKAAESVMVKTEEGKEYMLLTGTHCSIIRRTGDRSYEYLELQSASKKGWQKFTTKTLADRFGCKNKYSNIGKSYLIDIENFKGNSEFEHSLGYINTREFEQKKGYEGEEK